MSEKRVAIVTGANRGIGLEICRQLVEQRTEIVLTSRDENKGRAAVDALGKEGLKVSYHRLDVTDRVSVDALAKDIESQFGRLDILVNNAGIFPDATSASGDQWPSIFEADIAMIEKAMDTNVYGPIRLVQALVPLMKRNGYGRIVNLSSGMGQLTFMDGGCTAYRISKTGINAVTRILSQELDGTNILVNSMCPGWVKTDMGGSGATRELCEGADTAIFLATLPEGGPTGKFFRDRKEFEW